MSSGRTAFAVIGALLHLVLPLPAGENASASDSQGSIEKREAAYARLAAPANVADFSLPSVQLTLEGTSDAKRGTAALGLKRGDLHLDLKLSGPLDEKTKEAEPITLDGLAASATADLGLSFLHWPYRPDEKAIDAMCGQLGKKECDDVGFEDPKDRRRFLDLHRATETPVLVGARVKIGRNRFKYLQPDTLSDTAVNRNDWSVALAAGRYSPRTGFVVVQFQYQRHFQAGGPAGQVCEPLVAPGAVQCREAVIGAPTRASSTIGRFEVRRFFPGGRTAVAPTLKRDFEKRVTSFELPVYFLQDAKAGGLTGGLRLVWRSDTDAVSVAFFVGGALKLVEQP